MRYRIEYSPDVLESFAEHRATTEQPSGGTSRRWETTPFRQARPLRDLAQTYRIRVREWRLVYRVDDEARALFVLCVGQKEGPEFYRDLPEA